MLNSFFKFKPSLFCLAYLITFILCWPTLGLTNCLESGNESAVGDFQLLMHHNMNSGQHKPAALLDGSLALSEMPINWPKCLQGVFVRDCSSNTICFPSPLGRRPRSDQQHLVVGPSVAAGLRFTSPLCLGWGMKCGSLYFSNGPPDSRTEGAQKRNH